MSRFNPHPVIVACAFFVLPLLCSAQSNDGQAEEEEKPHVYRGWEWIAPFSGTVDGIEQDDLVDLVADLDDPLDVIEDEKLLAAEGDGRQGNLVIAPIPFSNPTLGFGTALVAAYITKLDPNDTVSPPSTLGVAGFYSENDSYMGAAIGKLYIKEDRYRVGYGLARGEINYKFYGIGHEAGERGRSIKIEQPATMGQLELLRQIAPNTFAGLAYSVMDTEINIRNSDLTPAVLASGIFDDIMPGDLDGLDLVTAALGLRLLYDSRDHPMYPRKGFLVSLNLDLYDDAFGSDVDYEVLEIAFNKYWTLSERDVLAYRLMYRDTSSDAPFFALSSFGSNNDLRGYEAGRYRDRMMYATQVEHRRKWTDKFGTVLFGGVGGVASRVDEIDFDDLLPSIGTGIRWKLSKDHPLHYSIDVAAGKDDVEIYFGLGESF